MGLGPIVYPKGIYNDINGNVLIGTLPDDYSKFEPDGTLEFNGKSTVWDDIKFPALQGRTGATNPPTFTKYKDNGSGSFGVFTYYFADQGVAGNEEQLWFLAQISHDWNGGGIEAHVHWTPAVNGSANQFVKWGLEYTWADIDGNFGNTTVDVSNASSAIAATTSGDTTLLADKHYVTEITDLSASGKGISSMLACRIFRNSSHADDDLAQNAVLFELDFHYERNTIGSRTEYVK